MAELNRRELLTRAARAASIRIVEFHADGTPHVAHEKWGMVSWDPLAAWGSGAALGLAVKLGLEVRQVHLKAHAGRTDQFWETVPHGNDAEAATRLAIVRAAARLDDAAEPAGVGVPQTPKEN